tara:strand:- start:1811 stop:2479 length:669 start_codon:yes stop_codon:yes gene_type:complete
MYKIIIAILLVISISFLTADVFAQNEITIEIILSSNTYSFGDKLEYQIIVSDVTNENAVLYIIDESGKKSQLLTIPIEIENTIVTAPFPFDSIVWNEGNYILEIVYSGISFTQEFNLVDDGKVSLPFWFKDVAMMWVTNEATDKDYVRNIIGQLIEEKIIVESYEPRLDENLIVIPNWHKTIAEWWVLGHMSDTEFVGNIQFLLEKNIIMISETQISEDSSV